MKKIAVIALTGLLPFSVAHAQQDSTLNRTVVVENEYNPTVMDASKINVLPQIEEPAVAKKGIEYATALRPALFGNEESMPPIVREWMRQEAQRGYVRGGYGNYGNVDFKAGYVWDIAPKDRMQVAVSLDGMNGTLKDISNQDWKSRFYSSMFNVDYRHSFKRVDMNLGGGMNSQVFNYMKDPAVSALEASDKQHHTLGNFRVGVASTDELLPVQFIVETGFKYFKQKYPALQEASTEKMVHTEADVWGKINELQRVGIKMDMDNLFYSGGNMKNYTSLCLNPYYMLDSDNWRIRLGAHVDWLTGEGNGIDVAPDVKAEYIFSDSYILYLHAQGGRQLNDFRRLNAISPYWAVVGQPVATYVPLDATFGFKTSPASGLWLNLFGGYQIRDNELFCALTAGGQFLYTGFLQDKGKIGYGGMEVKYGYKDYFDVSLKGTYYSWKASESVGGVNEDIVTAMKPEMDVDLKVDVKVFEGLKVNLGYEYVKRKGENVDPVNNLGVGASYQFLKGLSVFANVDNLLNKRYYYEGGYPAEKLNVLGGFSFQF